MAFSETQKRRVGRPVKGEEVVSGEELLKSALKAFAKKGYDNVSLRELTRQWGVNHNLVHHRFGSKEGLWRASVDQAAVGISAEVARIIMLEPSDGEEIERIKQAAFEVAMMVFRHPDCFRVFLDEARSGGARFDYIYENYVVHISKAVTDQFNRAVSRGEARDMPIHLLHILLMAGVTAPLNLTALSRQISSSFGGSKISREEEAGAIVDFLANALSPHPTQKEPRRKGETG